MLNFSLFLVPLQFRLVPPHFVGSGDDTGFCLFVCWPFFDLQKKRLIATNLFVIRQWFTKKINSQSLKNSKIAFLRLLYKQNFNANKGLCSVCCAHSIHFGQYKFKNFLFVLHRHAGRKIAYNSKTEKRL